MNAQGTIDSDKPVLQSLEQFDPFAPDYLRDPYPTYDQLRAEQPVYFSPMLRMWVVTRYEDIVAVNRDHKTFSQSAARLLPTPKDLRHRVTEDWFEEAFMNSDPPIHTVARKAVNEGFTRKRIAAAEVRIREISDSLIDAFVDDGHCEFMGQYAYPMGARTMSSFVGFPDEDMPKLKKWSQDLLVLAYPRAAEVNEDGTVTGKEMPDEELHDRWAALADCRDYLHAALDDRRENPRDDMMTVLINLKDKDGEQALSTERVVTHLIDLIAAGTDTVAPLMAHTLTFLLENPDQLEQVKQSDEAMNHAIDEGLRMRGTAHLLFRYATADAELGGVSIPAGSVIGLCYGAGGHDEEVFSCPHQYDINRPNVDKHLAFGKGRHFCLGAPLARAEARISLQQLLERLPNLRRTPGQTLDYYPAITVFMLKAMDFEWDAPSKAAA